MTAILAIEPVGTVRIRAGEIYINVPWPDKRLSPNARVHHMALAKVKKQYRADCALIATYGRVALSGMPLSLHLDFHPPDARRRDRDNLLASMKAGIDGVCDALGIDDSAFDPVSVSLKSPVKGGQVVLRIRREDQLSTREGE